MVSDLSGLIGPWDLNCVKNKGTSFASCAFTLEGSWLVALLTRKLPKSLPCLNQTSKSTENMCLVSGSLRRIYTKPNTHDLIARFCGCKRA